MDRNLSIRCLAELLGFFIEGVLNMATLVKGTYLNAKTGESITYDEFAFGLGQQTRLTQEESQVWHEQYLKESPSARKEWLHEWQHEFIKGNLGVSSKEADRILSTPKGKRTREQQLAYLQANSKFGYHIVRKEKKAKKASGKGSVVAQKKVTVAEVLALYKQLDKSGKAEFKEIIG